MRIALIGFGSSFHLYKWSQQLSLKHKITVYLFGNDERGFGSLQIDVRFISLKPNKVLPIVFSIYDSRYDVVHIHYLGKSIIYGILLLAHNNLIISLYGSDLLVNAKSNRVFRNLLLFVCRQSRAVQCTSEHMRSVYISMGGDTKRLSVIPFGVDESLFQVDRCEEKQEKFTFGIVKKMEPVYNVELFLDAFVLLAKKYDHLECVVYGGGSLLDVLIEKYSEEGIVFYGWIENSEVPVAYSRMDVAVIPSLSESFGVSAIEAAMCGVPVIASRVGGLPEIVEDGKVGLLFRSDDVNDLYTKMENILLDENKFNSIRLQCRRSVIEKYSIDHTTRIQNELYNEFIK